MEFILLFQISYLSAAGLREPGPLSRESGCGALHDSSLLRC